MILLSLLLIACGKEDGTLSPTNKDIDWFTLSDSNDEIDHMRYQIYQSTDISIYYNDTVSVQFRGLDGYGDSILHYEILTPEYSIAGNSSTIAYTLSQRRDFIKNGVVFLRDDVLPQLHSNVYPRSFLLVENLVLYASYTEDQGKRVGTVYKGLTTTVVSRIGELAQMTSDQKRVMAAEVAAPIWYAFMADLTPKELQNFFDISEGSVTWRTDASWTTVYNRPVNSKYITDSGYIPYKPYWYEYGFINRNFNVGGKKVVGSGTVYTLYTTPTKSQDACDFIQAVLTYTESDFVAMYSGVTGGDLIVRKFREMNSVMNAVRSYKK